jgi:hypothetical protein
MRSFLKEQLHKHAPRVRNGSVFLPLVDRLMRDAHRRANLADTAEFLDGLVESHAIQIASKYFCAIPLTAASGLHMFAFGG